MAHSSNTVVAESKRARLERLEVEYQAVSRQLEVENSPRARVQLEGQLRLLEQEMSELEGQLRQLAAQPTPTPPTVPGARERRPLPVRGGLALIGLIAIAAAVIAVIIAVVPNVWPPQPHPEPTATATPTIVRIVPDEVSVPKAPTPTATATLTPQPAKTPVVPIEAPLPPGEELLNSAVTSHRDQSFEMCVEQATAGLDLNPDDWIRWQLYQLRGLCQEQLKQDDSALRDFGRAIELNPEAYVSLRRIGVIHHFRGDHEQALDYYTRAIDAGSDSWVIFFNRGLIYLMDDHWNLQRALADFETAVELHPSSKTWYNLGLALSAQDPAHRADAIQAFSNAIDLDDPGDHVDWSKSKLATICSDLRDLSELANMPQDIQKICADYQ